MTDTPADRAIEIADAIFQNDCIAKRELIPAIERAIAEAVEGERREIIQLAGQVKLKERGDPEPQVSYTVGDLWEEYYTGAHHAVEAIQKAVRDRSQS